MSGREGGGPEAGRQYVGNKGGDGVCVGNVVEVGLGGECTYIMHGRILNIIPSHPCIAGAEHGGLPRPRRTMLAPRGGQGRAVDGMYNACCTTF